MSEMIDFTIPGEPKEKERPRMTKTGHVFTPKKTVDYEAHIRNCYTSKHGQKQLKGYIGARIVCYLGIAKKYDTKKQAETKAAMIAKQIRPTKKPDLDNVCKAILDSLNAVAYADDSAVTEITISKFYGENPRIEVELFEMGGEPA